VSTSREINRYLFYEFGFDDEYEIEEVSEAWPFELRSVGKLRSGAAVYEFADGTEEFFVIDGSALNFLSKQGLTVHDLDLQELGSSWIAAQEPVDLNTSQIGDDSVPSAIERRLALQQLASAVDGLAQILEGLYLKKSGHYLGLVQIAGSNDRFVVGTELQPRACPHRSTSRWRELSIQVGEMLESGSAG